ncbi:DUF6934 family protein [Spirosoma radiotolerans]|uniref:Uncharacterized protein n=1 Tax=Spirosoma radiotolerans TaxID=1379870 RepID=A0A0E3ZUI4_9BACT|nr:hypothetical protein [Spirosoma radiotolerans]AKD54483.1 hypothetical protein SD10_05720 [Spirosoma radiotolerans]
MNQPFYEFTSSIEALRYEFTSIGQRVVRKVIIYQELPFPNVYNLALGDTDDQGKADFGITSDNGDRDTILATVIQTLITFFHKYPQASVFIAGSTPSRTRLYQGVINRELGEIQKRFDVLGVTEDGTESFSKGKSYQAFVISLKQL